MFIHKPYKTYDKAALWIPIFGILIEKIIIQISAENYYKH
jgi:hypothetical protein